MTATESWTCPTCGRAISTRYCGDCGERPRDPRELTLRGLFLQVFHAFTNLDGKVARSLRDLLVRPGALSVAFVRGRRMAYVGPFQLFFLVNVAFFALESATRTSILSSKLANHVRQQNWSELADRLVERKLAASHATLADYAPVFDRAVTLNAKSLIILMVLPFALLLALVFRGRQPLVGHAVFALHFFTFVLVLFCATLCVTTVHRWMGGAGLDSNHADTVLTFASLAACAAYLFVAVGAFYRSSGQTRAFQTAELTVAVAAIVLGYRFSLFLITLYGTAPPAGQ